MKKMLKRVVTLCVSAALVALLCLTASAASFNKYGVSVNGEVTLADSGDIVFSYTVKNHNDFSVTDFSFAPQAPDGYKAQSNGLILKSFGADEERSGSLIFLTDANARKASVRTGITVALIAAAIIAVLIFARKREKTLALLLALCLVLPLMPLNASASANFKAEYDYTLNCKANGSTYPIDLSIAFESETEITRSILLTATPNHESGSTLTDFSVSFSGKAISADEITSIGYSVASEVDDWEADFADDFEMSGCAFEGDVPIKKGENKITVTAVTDTGKTKSEEFTFTFDNGELYAYKQDEVATQDEVTFVKNVINVYFQSEATSEEIDAFVAAHGERIGEINGVKMVQIRVDAESLDELNAKCAEFEKNAIVKSAIIEAVVPLISLAESSKAAPNDPWCNSNEDNSDGSLDVLWDESYPSGRNWHYEALEALSARKYSSYYQNVKLGVVDTSIHAEHEDFKSDLIMLDATSDGSNQNYTNDSNYFSTLSEKNHGTHVTGIIAATADNGIGIAGLVPDVNIYSSNWNAASNYYSDSAISNAVSYIVQALTDQVTSGAKAINFSLGINNSTKKSDPSYNPYLNPLPDSVLYATAKPCAAAIDSLINANKEFVVIQSSGNGIVDTRISDTARRSADAYLNGLFCSIREGEDYGKISTANVLNRIIIVGAVQRFSKSNGEWCALMWQYGNSGDRVDVYAPGCNIFSTVASYTQDGQTYRYAYDTGTSMAAPCITAIAGICFSVNPTLSGSEVKSIICDKNNSRWIAYDCTSVDAATGLDRHPFTGNSIMPSLLLCAEAALKTLGGRADYAQLNRTLAIINSLVPEQYSNYDEVKPQLDLALASINYDLYPFQQELVTQKNLELLGILNQLKEVVPANYDKVDAAIKRAEALKQNDYFDFSAVTEAINAVDRTKYDNEQAEVDKMAQAINDAIDALVPKPALDSDFSYDIVFDDTEKLVVVTPYVVDYLQDSITCSDSYDIAYTPNSGGNYSTGAVLTLTGEKTTLSYTVATLGDVDGDGDIDGGDGFLINMYSLGLAKPQSTAQAVAANVDCFDGIDEYDLEYLCSALMLNDEIYNAYTPR